jgi:nitrate reductase NapE component
MNPLLVEEALDEKKDVAPFLKWPANFFSYIFHPAFIPIYVIVFLVYVHPSYFSGFSQRAKLQTVLISIINLVAFPLLSVALLKALGFIDSIFLRTRKDRIIPYMACGILFFWAYTVFKKQEMYPPIMSTFILGVFLAASAGLIANIYFKISMHTMGVGGLLGIFWVIAKENSMLMTWPLALAILITGIVCTSRMLVSNHTQKDIYVGLLVGFASELVAAFVS